MFEDQRAQVAAVVVANPALLDTDAKHPEQLPHFHRNRQRLMAWANVVADRRFGEVGWSATVRELFTLASLAFTDYSTTMFQCALLPFTQDDASLTRNLSIGGLATLSAPPWVPGATGPMKKFVAQQPD